MWQVLGQEHLLGHIEASLIQGRPAHAYLLVGPPHVGKMTLALNMAQSVNCLLGPGAPCGACVQCERIALGRHAAVRVVSPGRPREQGEQEGDERGRARTVIGIRDVKEALGQVYLKPYEGACSVIIFDRADLMSEDAANALLKTLEEPPSQVMMLLLTADEEAMLPTVRSRCRRLGLRPMRKVKVAEKLVSDYQASPQDADRLSRLARGCPGWAIGALKGGEEARERREVELEGVKEMCETGLPGRFEYANDLAALFTRDREAARQSLYTWLHRWRDLLLIKEGGEEYILNIDRRDELRLQASQLTSAQIVRFVKRLLETLEALDRNANPRLALEVLMLDLPATTVPS